MKNLVGCIDLTSLNVEDTTSDIEALCLKAKMMGPTAAVCIFPGFVSTAKATLGDSKIKLATVLNFPLGQSPLETVLRDIDFVMERGADEIDIVIPYQAFIDGERGIIRDFVAGCKQRAPTKLLKVILETGMLKTPALIRAAADEAIEGGADFLKTSTGKVPFGATPESVQTLLEVILSAPRAVGLKISGGISTPECAATYAAQVSNILGADALVPARFRIGASRLLDALADGLSVDSEAEAKLY